MAEAQKKEAQAATNAPAVLQKDITDSVMLRVSEMEQTGGLIMPKNYSAANQIKAAWFALQECKDRSGRPALDVCTKSSIANALLDMVVQGLSASKKQGYFIVYGDKLEFQRSYFGTVALAKAVGMQGNPVANVVYEGDDFAYCIDTETGLTKIVKHEQKFENVDMDKIKGAYAIVTMPDGQKQVTVMSIQQIKAAWGQGATKGNSPAHKNFSDEMCKKTVIGRACKMIINSSDDAYLFDGKSDDMDAEKRSDEVRNTARSAGRTKVAEEVSFEEVSTVSQPEPAPEPEPSFDPDPRISDRPLDGPIDGSSLFGDGANSENAPY